MEKPGQTVSIWPWGHLWSVKNQDFFYPRGKKKSAQKSGLPLPGWLFPGGSWPQTVLRGPHQSEKPSAGKDSLSPLKAKHGDVMFCGGWRGRYLNKKTGLLRRAATSGQAPGPALPAKLFPP